MKRTFRLSESKPDPRRDVSDEIQFHIDMRTQELIDSGMSPADARRAAVASFGDLSAVEAECREERARRARDYGRRDRLGGARMDVAYALRTLRKSPGFTVAALLTLGLGIGATAAVFTVVNGVLLRPLPYTEPSRLVMVWTRAQLADGAPVDWPLSAPNYVDIRSWNWSIESLAGFRSWPYVLSDGEEPERLAGSRVDPSLFPTLGVRPLLGRTFTPDEANVGAPKVAVIGYDLWRRRFGGTPDVVGRQATLSGERFTIIGVMPPGFAFPRGAELPAPLGFRPRTEVWTPRVVTELDMQARGTQNLSAVGRLRRGVSLEAARADLARVAKRLTDEYPRYNARLGLNAITLKDQAAAPVRRGLLMLMGAVALVLLIACANVANLLVARTAARDREFAVRAALGATRLRVARQLVTENVLLALGGAALGLLLAVWGSRALLALVPGSLPRADDVGVDWRVLIVTLAVAVLAGSGFGVATALRTNRVALASGLQGLRSTSGVDRRTGRRLLATAEVALSLILLVGAGLLTQSFVNLQRITPGFDPSGTLTAGLPLPITDFNPARDGPKWAAVMTEYADRLNALPGVEVAGGVSSLPLSGIVESAGFAIEGRPLPEPGQGPSAGYSIVTPGYFRAMRIPLRTGRLFDSRDRADGPPVVVVNEEFVRRYFPEERAVGRRLLRLWSSRQGVEIIGVVGDTRQTELATPPQPALYMPQTQAPYPSLTFVVRTKGDPSAALPAMRRELRAVDPSLALQDVKPMRAVFDASLARQRFSMTVIGAFAAAALALAVVGLYGVIAYGVTQRTREIGVRIALGARAGDVLRLVLGDGVRMAIAGVAVGVLGALALTRLIRSLLYDVSPTNPVVYAAVSALLVAVTLAASYIPARRATRVDPTTALRDG